MQNACPHSTVILPEFEKGVIIGKMQIRLTPHNHVSEEYSSSISAAEGGGACNHIQDCVMS
jgi:hypothetical protein